MDNTHDTPGSLIQHGSAPSGLFPVIDRFLDAVEAGKVRVTLYTADAVLDATVPGWRFQRRGSAAIASEYGDWFADPGRLEELERLTVDDGEVVTYFLTWEESGVPHAAHHTHRIVVDPVSGLIAADRVSCGGRWGAQLLAAMGEAGR